MSDNKSINPICWVPTVYFAMGLPFVALSMVSVLMFSDMGVSNAQIAFWTSLIMLPWTLKPLWSPFLEMFKTKKYFVVATQMVTGVAFGLVALSLPLPDFFCYAIAFMGVIAFSGATHDIAGDGVYLTELNATMQAKYIGWQGAFYNLAKILTNGGLVYLAGSLKDSIGIVHAWMVIMGICAAIMVVLSLYHVRMLPSGGAASGDVRTVKDAMHMLWEVIRTFFQKKYIVWYICFIILYRFAEGYVMKIVPLFLKAGIDQGGLGLPVQEIGIIYGTFGAAAFVLGSILAGYYISAFGLRKTLFSLCCVFNIPFVVYLLLAIYQPSNVWVIGSAIVFEYFGYGFGFVGLTLFMMQQVAPGKHQMAHYAFASGIMNLGVMIPGMMSGYLSDWLGYRNFFIWVLVATIPAFLVTWFVPFTYNNDKKETTDRINA
ncbi:MFS transporter [Coprobacter fastidiosus]|uniref:PAT family beta-lactamase induction signal transducer AmpG n=1 Tax=Coprobacter fastidiosus NSB1 = JCM 33896 TaxID=1349822 RepID=A0A495VK79_9BACT|nr:MFS transporter [Coprobacter fastidiosus]MBS6410870.1 MFS transporter [Tannerella sp.]ERM90251.1 major facilitator transporter [Coprobacter fastidiosus NSB1 = JCM 33896]RKT49759.1 PAT family beta-lactamase induction signal transducer AmpG [Coprobacter fastidiosus NSB1 = JCM 33896]BEG63040.1 MFS transporter [Coprobacter fastidiosus]HJF43890.1 MFS transporter [Coprobacter fastidiosus]